MGVPDHQGNGKFGIEQRSENVELHIAAATCRIKTRSDIAFSQSTLVLGASVLGFATIWENTLSPRTFELQITFRVLYYFVYYSVFVTLCVLFIQCNACAIETCK